MAKQRPLPGKPRQEPFRDEWGTTTRVGYEDRPVYQPRRATRQRNGSRFLRLIGSLLVIAGVIWTAYVVTSVNGVSSLLKPGVPAPPVLVLAGGLLVLVVERLLR